jgi:hypothetical protein
MDRKEAKEGEIDDEEVGPAAVLGVPLSNQEEEEARGVADEQALRATVHPECCCSLI